MRTGILPTHRRADSDPSTRRGFSGPGAAGAALFLVAVLMSGCAGTFEEEPPPEPTATVDTKLLASKTLDLAEQALAEERLNDAQQLVERVFLGDPGNVRARLLRGEVLLARGEAAQAASVFVGLTSDPEWGPRAEQGAGIAKLLTSEEDVGADHLRTAVEADPTLWRAWNALGSYYDSKGEWAPASEAYGYALAERNDEAMIYNNRGFSLFMQGRLEDSIADLRRALQLDPDLVPAEVNLRLALAWSGRYVHALTGARDDDMATILNNIGYVALMRGDLDNAETYLLRAMEADPAFNEVAWRNLAYLRNLRELEEGGEAAVDAAELAKPAGLIAP